MQKIFTVLGLLLSLSFSFGQSTYVPLNKDYYHLLDRYEILNGKFSTSFFTTDKPIQRKDIASFLDSIQIDSSKLSKSDRYNLTYLSIDNWEWTNSPNSTSKKPIFKYFYKKKSDLYSVHNEDFDLHVNPVIYWQFGKESQSSDSRYINTRGIEVRGIINQKIGFYTFMADNQAAFPTYVQNYSKDFHAVPGEGYYKTFKKNKGVDFLTARGYFTFSITKNIQFQFGHDKNFIGDGYRTLILSDYSSNYTFLKVNVKVWKINYLNLFTEMNADVKIQDQRYPKKYLALHHLSLNVTKNLNFGVFESIVFGAQDTLKHGQFNINYLNPIIFYRSIEQQGGSNDNATLGANFKWNFLRHFSMYGQIVLDEFLLSQVKSGKGWWANKQGGQLGLKYINALGVKNLDFQGELNVVRPYTYTHKSHFTSYTHYNQPLAHPLGANFYELIGIARYQPISKLSLTGKLFYTKIGLDSNTTNINVGYNYGSNPLKSYTAIATANTFGNRIAQGIKTNIVYLSFTATYQVKHNLFLDLTQVIRKFDSAIDSRDLNTNFTAIALRWNIPQRLQEF